MPASADNLDAKFLIERKGKVIGSHIVDVTVKDEYTRVDTDITMKVKFGPFPVFRYRHESTEIWRGDEVYSIVSTTNNNGDEAFLNAKREEGDLMIDGSGYQGVAPNGATPSSYWNRDITNADWLINTQTGELIDIEVSAMGETQAPHNQIAEHYQLIGTVSLNLWYDGLRWVGCNFTVDGEELTYVLAQDPRQYAQLSAD